VDLAEVAVIGQQTDTDENGHPIIQFQPGNPVTGGWCVVCGLPPLMRVPLCVLSPRRVSLWQIIEACVEDGFHKHLPGKPELLRFGA
jgi:hypothetical protein